jgi:hypothetical protein
MTSTVTISCPYGIVIAADRRYTIIGDKGPKYGFVNKIFMVSDLPVGLSFWGTSNFEGKELKDFLRDFNKKLVSDNNNVNSVADKLKNHLEDIGSKIGDSMGFHIAGYCKNEEGELYPQIRHVFHETWLRKGKFINENSNEEYHHSNGNTTKYDYDPYIALFNGVRDVANLYFNLLPNIHPKGTRIILDKLTLDQCMKLAKLIVTSSGELLEFEYFLDGTAPYKSVKGVTVAVITPNKGFQWKENNRIRAFLRK